MTRDEAAGWLNDIIQRSADCDKMSIDDERLEAITVARDVLEAMAPDAETRLMLGIESPSQQLTNFKKDERTAADALMAGAKAIN